MSTEDETTDPLKEVLSQFRALNSRLDALEAKIDDRLRDTRPIWEQALKETVDLREEVRKGFAQLSRKIDIIHDDIYKLREDDRELRERVDKLESNIPTGQMK